MLKKFFVVGEIEEASKTEVEEADTGSNKKAESVPEGTERTEVSQENGENDSILADLKNTRRKKKLTDLRKPRTYYLSPEEIEMVDELSKKTGVGRYEIVGRAIQLPYRELLKKE